MPELTLDDIVFTQEDTHVVFNLAASNSRKKGSVVRTTVSREEFDKHQQLCQILIDLVVAQNQLVCVKLIGDSSFKITVFNPQEIDKHYAMANASQLSLLLIFCYYFKELDGKTIDLWAQELLKESDEKKKQGLFDCLEKYHPEIIATVIRGKTTLTLPERKSVPGVVLTELLELINITGMNTHNNANNTSLYLDYAIPDYYILQEHTEHSLKEARGKYVKIETLSELYYVVTHYRPDFQLPSLLLYKWIDACIQMLDNTKKNNARQEFYLLLNKWCYQVSLKVMEWLLMKYRNEPEVMNEIIQHVPQNITNAEKNHLKELLELLHEDLPQYDTQYDNILVKYFWFNHGKINKASSEKSVLFNLLKDDYPELMKKLHFLTAAKRYEELGQSHDIFDKKHHFTHLMNDQQGCEILIDFSTVHEMLLLKDSSIIDIQEWFHKKVFMYLQGNDFMQSWGIRYLSYEKTTSNNGFINLLWKNEPRFTQEMLKKSLCELFWQIRLENPDKIEEVIINPAKWFNACWLRLRLASLEEEGGSENQDTGSEGYIKI